MSSVPIGPITPAIKVNGSPISAAAMASVISIEVDRSLNLIGRATLRFVESAFDVAVQPTLGLGTEVEISIADGASLFKGTVTGFSIDQDLEGPAGTTLTVTVDDDGQKLTRSSTHKAYLQQTYSAVLSDMIGEQGLTASVAGPTAVEDYILQSGTPLSFLDWVCARFGLQWWVEGKTVTVEKVGTSSATVPLELGKTLIRLSTRASDRHPGSVTVTGWDPKQQVQVTHTASTKKEAESDLFSKVSGRGNPLGTITVPAGALTTDEATSVSGSLLAHATAAAVTTRGTAYVTPALKPGTTVTISGAGPASASYLVSRVQHVYSGQGFETRFVAGPLQPESLVDLLGNRPPNGGAMSGTLATAVVTNNKDDNKPGQVKVKLFLHGTGVDSQWARVVSLGGGASRGAVFHPEVGDEVLVGFENGDTRRPVVIGGLFSEKNTLPSTDNVESGKVAYRRITSRLGHIIELYDGTSADKQYVQLKTKGGHYVRVGEDKLELKVANKPVSITNGPAKIEFSDQGDITIEGNNVTIKGKQAVKIEGMEVGVKASTNAKIEGLQVDVKASASGSIDGGGALTVKGGTVAIN